MLTPRARVFTLTVLAMLAFAGNSLLCRIALDDTSIDPASFTAARLISAALVLALIVQARAASRAGGSWVSAVALFVYAAAFSFAYVSLSAATGALLLFSAVQATMIGHGVWAGERPKRLQLCGIVLAFAGLIGLLLPGLEAPPPGGAALMLLGGVAWGVYSLRGSAAADPVGVTAGNFLRAAPMSAALAALLLSRAQWDAAGVSYAVLSGALTSGLGYVIWYAALPGLGATQAATVQLSVPVIAALGGVLFLGESVAMRYVVASVAILGGIALVIRERRA
jgi:drug/metabolite transporter (DMT)-like permease